MKMKKAKSLIVLLGIVAMTALTGCFKPQSPSDQDKAVKVDFHYFQTEDGKEEYAVITGLNEANETVWEKETAKNMLMLTTEVQDIGTRGDHYYYQSSEGVFAVSVADGTQIWKNEEVKGEHFVWDEEDNLYMCSMLGPEFSAVDAKGNTLCVIDKFGEEYRWPSDIRIEDDHIAVNIMVDSGEEEYETVCIINMDDFSYDFAKG